MDNNIFSLVFGKDKEGLAREFKGFEFRPQQIQMARAVENALLTGKHLVVEAGTGVGKSLAYLLPFIKRVTGRDGRIVISTYTKTLQRQLVEKDLPALKKMLGLDFRFALCLGSQNYLCIRRLRRRGDDHLFETAREKEEISGINGWALKTGTGVRSELDFTPGESTWKKICRETDLCLGKKCPFRQKCFYYKARREEYRAQILVTNHHLFFSHIASDGNLLPPFDVVIFDEAHTLEDVATDYLGIRVSNFQIKYFLDSLFNPRSGKGFLRKARGVSGEIIKKAMERTEEARHAARSFFSEAASRFGEESRTVRIREKGALFNHLKEPLAGLVSSLKDIYGGCDRDRDEDRAEIKSFISRAQKFSSSLDAITRMRLEEHVYWLEILKRPRGTRYTFFASPIDISGEFKKRIFDEIRPVILTSATLSTNGNFEFVKKRLGMDDDVDELILDSPFDYAENTVLYLPGELPDPGREAEAYRKTAVLEMKKILSLTEGRTFILFTSFKMMNRTHTELKESFEDLRILKQGEAPRYKLLEMFKRGKRTVLLGTNTFWQGIDIPGKALECVVISKLPFAVPDDPIIEAKMELLLSHGKNPFVHYQIPRAVIMLKQGFGRLIRTGRDRGIVAILDPRVRTRGYGKRFIDALPRCRQTSDLARAEQFLSGKG
ncbi:MAG: DEAD/DEAH box helicase [Candidatus Omnitrophica bacterium]|nr:DEAD/DEAH box helicase [Candidatus Omnitrophota bacterium]